MNPIIYLLFKSRRPLSNRDRSINGSDRGFALPIALMVGLVLMVVSLAMVGKSQSGQRDTSAQKATAEGLSIAETGVTRILDLINQNKYIAEIPDCVGTRDSSGRCPDDGGTAPSYTPTNTAVKSWANITSTDPAVQDVTVCAKPAVAGATPTPEQLLLDKIKAEAIIVDPQIWKPLDSSNLDKGQYRLISYNFDGSSTGTLTIEGRVNTNKVNSGGSRLTVSFPVVPNQVEPTVPGVWLTVGDTGSKNKIQGNALLSDCNGDPSIMQIAQPSPPVNPPYSVVYTKQTMPSLPAVSCPIDTSVTPSVSAWSFPASAATYITPANKLNNHSGSITLPRAGDTSVSRTLNNGNIVDIYEYCVNRLDDPGSNSITITPGQRVTFYLKGDIAKNDIFHSCVGVTSCSPADFQIFAYGQPVGGNRPKICLNGNGIVEAFILAPEYTAGVAGGGNTGGLKGTLWAYDWSDGGDACGSNTQAIVVTQMASWGEMYGLGLPQNQPPTLQNISNWQRQQR